MKHSRLSVFSFSSALVVVLLWALTFIGCGSDSSKTSQTTPVPAPGTPPPPSGGSTGSSGGSTSGGTTTGGTSGSTTGSSTGGSTTGGTTSGGTTTGSGTGGSTGGSGSTGSGTGGSGSGSGGGTTGGGTTGSGGSSSISGTIVDAQTNAPIDGTVNVLLEGGIGDPQVLMQTTADADGHFQFDNVSSSQRIFAVVTSASGSDGTFYTPALLIAGNGSCGSCGNAASGGDPITPGTNVGTIPLQRSSTTGFMDGTVSSSDEGNNNPVAVRVTANLMTTFELDRPFPVALPSPPQEFKTDTAVRTCGDGHGACAAYTFQVPTDRVLEAFFSHSGYSFSPAHAAPNYRPIFSAFSLDTGEPDCSPSTIKQFGGAVKPGGTVIIATDKFENCQ